MAHGMFLEMFLHSSMIVIMQHKRNPLRIQRKGENMYESQIDIWRKYEEDKICRVRAHQILSQNQISNQKLVKI